jgi:hypothetical protein
MGCFVTPVLRQMNVLSFELQGLYQDVKGLVACVEQN